MSEQPKPTLKLVVSGSGEGKSLVPSITDVKELIESICQDMDLIPNRGDVMVYKKGNDLKAYITKSGYSRMANHKRISTKIEILEKNFNPAFAMVKATAITPKGNFFEEIAECDCRESGKQDKPFSQILGMAITRATNRALNRATCQNACSYEEFIEGDEQSEAKDLKDLVKLVACPSCHEKTYFFDPTSKLMVCSKCGYCPDAEEEKEAKV